MNKIENVKRRATINSSRCLIVCKLFRAAAIGIVFLLTALPLQADVDFSGKTVTWIIPFKEGGGSDRLARFYAPRLSRALPGQPGVVVKNMPGIASIKGANYFALSGVEPDGLTILGTSGSTQFPYLLNDPRVRYNYKDWHVVLASATGGVVYLPAELGEKWNTDPKSVIDTYYVFGSQGPGRLDLIALLAFEMIGMKVEPIFGIKGRDVGRTMFERGEVNIDYQTTTAFLSQIKPLVDAGRAVPIMSWGVLDEGGNIVRDPTFPDLPTFKEVYTRIKGKEPSGDAWKAWKAFFVAGFSAQKMLFLPKGTPQEIVDTYTRAVRRLLDEESFSADAKKHLGLYPQVTGEIAKDFLRRGTQVEPELIDWIKGWLKRLYGVRL
ncbi:MAG: hypothetical protein ABW146_06205 [Candidatus Sedimenticola sp. 6PFRAG7]